MFQTEFEFVLPCGFLDEDGSLHREGVMRRATAADEILPLKDPRVQKNEAYLIVILLSRVVTRLGSLPVINPKVVEGLFATDLAYLQDLYNRINALHDTAGSCPHCGQPLHAMGAAGLGESSATPSLN
ncbi:phage tail assembly protein [Variovorax sp. YR752]|uniref:phage tail assembly protein n=1 Tax=Variovorax sp. YR752 TaxID=1884383 RepID=UPI003137BDFA